MDKARTLGLLAITFALGCGGSSDASTPPDDATIAEDAGTDANGDVVVDAPLDAATDAPAWDGSLAALQEGVCAHNADLGAVFTDGFGRADGVVSALVPPTVQCEASHNGTHLTVEVTIAGKIERLVVTMQSSVGDPKMRYAERDAPLLGGAWSEGWHLGTPVDYVTNLGVHAADFAVLDMPTLTHRVTQAIDVGDRVSIFATCEGRPESAHLVHRSTTGPGHDGAIVVRPDATNAHWLLFHFADQDNQFP